MPLGSEKVKAGPHFTQTKNVMKPQYASNSVAMNHGWVKTSRGTAKSGHWKLAQLVTQSIEASTTPKSRDEGLDLGGILSLISKQDREG